MQAIIDKPGDKTELLDLIKSDYREDAAIFCGGLEARAADFAGIDLDTSSKKAALVDLSALNKVHEHIPSDMVIGVQTGILISELSAILAEHGQLFPVDLQERDCRLIDVINRGDGGYLEQGYGYLRSSILGVELVYEGGKNVRLGGRVVKNVTGFDLTKLVVGGRGAFGIPHFAYLRLFARPEATLNFVLEGRGAADLLFLASKLGACGVPLTALELVEKINVAQNYSYVLIVQIGGTRLHVAEISKQIRLLVNQEKEHVSILELSCEELAEAYPVMVRTADISLEVSLSRASASALIDHLASFAERGTLRYRQAMGRLFLDCPDASTLANAAHLVGDFLSSTKRKTGGNALAEFDQAIVGKSVGPFIFSSSAERTGDADIASVIGNLRRTFDPLACFGQGVTFHGR
ncbi:MAG: FAD-binding oxidoreductase [Cyanobacteria bacterium REEB67]|nr:FAD-binding oxidoreductase [Cyanobacteria bacterium REEB67]